MAAVQVVRAVGTEHDDVLVARPRDDEPQQIARGLVGPVQVLEHEQHQAVRARQVGQQPTDRIEELQPAHVVPTRGGTVAMAEQA